jgi:isochorismate synthase
MRATSNVLSEQLTEAEILNFLLDFAFSNGYSVAAWKLPNQPQRKVILSWLVRPQLESELLEELAPGFLFAPFDPAIKPMFFAADLEFTFDNDTLAAPSTPTEVTSHDLLTEKLNEGFTPGVPRYYTNPEEVNTNTEEQFLNAVIKGIAAIESGLFEKVVPSRNKYVTLPKGFDLVQSFDKLCTTYPNAFVSVISSPITGTWMGASPEELVRISNKTIFRTVALAGTQPYQPGTNLRNVAWTQKEIEEQALVERYIISCFKKIRLREYDEHGPKTVVAGNLIHLRSDFTVNMVETNFPLLGSTMLKLLHPTSAVCGMPMEAAMNFLLANEGYNRGFYAGYIGPVNIGNQIDLFVNLRCMQLTHDHAVVYAGAGVTIDSIPDQECEETEMKMNTLLAIL